MNDGTNIIASVGLMILGAAMMMLLSRRLRIPSIVAYILTGLVLGPIGFNLLTFPTGHAADHDTAVAISAELGIVLLLFLVGLELSLDNIRAVGKVAVAAGIGQVIFTAALGFGLALLLGFTTIEALFLATALTFSSTVVVVKLLDQKKQLHTLYGRIAVGIFLVQDLVVIIVLTFLTGLGDPESATFASLAGGIGRSFLGMAIMLSIALVSSRFLLPRPMAWAASSAETSLIWSLGWCFAFVIGAEMLSLSPEIGAFLAGLSLAQLPVAHDLRRRLHPLMNFFIAIFFISLGVQMELQAATAHWLAAIVLALFVIIGNPFIFMLIITRAGYSERTSFMTSVTVAQISEFSFIFAAVGLSAGLIDDSILSLITVIGLITIAVSAYMILYSEGLYERVRKWGWLRPFRAAQTDDDQPALPLQDHIIVVGMNAMGRCIVNQLHEQGETVLAVDSDARKLADLPGRTLQGSMDYLAVTEEAFLERAKLVVSTLHIESSNNLLAYRCQQAGVPTAVHAFDASVVPDLELLGVDYLLDPKKAWVKEAVAALSTIPPLPEVSP
jgi:Kef-type K+ transport system membrane component KefB